VLYDPCTISRCSGWWTQEGSMVVCTETNMVCMSARFDALGLWSCGPGFDLHASYCCVPSRRTRTLA